MKVNLNLPGVDRLAGAVTLKRGTDAIEGLVFDARGLTTSDELVELQRFFYPRLSDLPECGRVVVIGEPPEACDDWRHAVAQRALEGFTRSLAKEVGRGITVQLVQVEAGAEYEPVLGFLLSGRSAYVSGQVLRVDVGVEGLELDGARVIVTGSARGIGAAIVEVLRREGAEVIGVDVSEGFDITEADAPARIVELAGDAVDVIVHNAGVTRDRTLAKMPEERWSSVMDINLGAPERITEALVDAERLRSGVVCVSSMSGIAGNAGQTNYAASKAGLIGMVEALAPSWAEQGLRINAVAPGFIETEMTARMPLAVREVGRRMNSLRQGGLPVDVAEAVAFLAAAPVTGNVLRVCGQSLLGA